MNILLRAYEFCQKWEGGSKYTNDPRDAGGATKYGVALNYNKDSIPDKNNDGIIDEKDIQLLEDSDSFYLYKNKYWIPAKCDDMPPAIAFMYGDMVWSIGPSTSPQVLQQALNTLNCNLVVDGKIGPKTLSALFRVDQCDFLHQLNDERIAYYKTRPKWPDFGTGWVNRANDCLKESLAILNELEHGSQQAEQPQIIEQPLVQEHTMDFAIIEQLQDVMKKKGYAFFTKGNFNVNLIAIRTSNKFTNKFDDYFLTIYKDSGVWRIYSFPCTTKAGAGPAKSPSNTKGIAIIKPGQWKGCWGLGMHKQTQQALVQIAPITVYRDNTKDGIIDYNATDTGMFGINVHWSSLSGSSQNVDKWSEGCIVGTGKHRDDWLDILVTSKSLFGNKFTLTLLEKTDFVGV